jgi:hypothetical protein
MQDGARHSSTVNAPRGSGPRGIEWADVEHKVRALTPESGKSAGEIERLLALGHGFEELKDVRALIEVV